METVSQQKLKVAINGFGRIGRNFLRCWNGRESSLLDVVAINDSGGVKQVGGRPLSIRSKVEQHSVNVLHICLPGGRSDPTA